jgi:mannose-binding lectin 2
VNQSEEKLFVKAVYLILFADHVEDPKPSSLTGIKIFLLMLVGTLAVIACVVIGIMFYQKHQENSRKRFY